VLEGVASFIGSFRKMAPVPLLAIGIATGVLLFAPDMLAKTLGVADFANQYRGIIGGIFIIAWSYLFAHLLWWGRGRAFAAYESWHKVKIRESQLRELTPEEKYYLKPYISDDINTQRFSHDDGVVGGLVGKNILYRASNLIDINEIPYNIQPWARRYLKNHRELLEGSQPPSVKQSDDHW